MCPAFSLTDYKVQGSTFTEAILDLKNDPTRRGWDVTSNDIMIGNLCHNVVEGDELAGGTSYLFKGLQYLGHCCRVQAQCQHTKGPSRLSPGTPAHTLSDPLQG